VAPDLVAAVYLDLAAWGDPLPGRTELRRTATSTRIRVAQHQSSEYPDVSAFPAGISELVGAVNPTDDTLVRRRA
jgi:hypothetical protein